MESEGKLEGKIGAGKGKIRALDGVKGRRGWERIREERGRGKEGGKGVRVERERVDKSARNEREGHEQMEGEGRGKGRRK